MSNKKDHVESLIFEHETTQRTDYRERQPLHLSHVTEKVESSKDFRKSNEEKNKTVSEKPSKVKENTLPKKTKIVEREADLECIRRFHPKSVIPPAVCIDDIEDPRVRQILIRDVYTSTARRSYNQPVTNVARAPLPSQYTLIDPLSDPIRSHPLLPNVLFQEGPSNFRREVASVPQKQLALPKLTPSYVAPEWRMESAGWDKRQMRTNEDPTKVFWLSRNAYKEADKH